MSYLVTARNLTCYPPNPNKGRPNQSNMAANSDLRFWSNISTTNPGNASFPLRAKYDIGISVYIIIESKSIQTKTKLNWKIERKPLVRDYLNSPALPKLVYLSIFMPDRYIEYPSSGLRVIIYKQIGDTNTWECLYT